MTAFRQIIDAAAEPVRPQCAPWRPMRQSQLADWDARTFAQRRIRSPAERAARLVREVAELARAAGLSQEQVQAQSAVGFDGPGCEMDEAAGAAGVALLNFCEAVGLDADEAESRQINRLLSLPPGFFGAAVRPASRPAIRPPAARAHAAEREERVEPTWAPESS